MSKSWGQMAEEERAEIASRRNLIIIDGLNLAFRFKDKAKAFAPDYVKTIFSLAQSYRAKDILFLSDKGKSKFRTEIYPEYKANREAKYDSQTEEEKEKSKQFFEMYEDALELLETKLKVWRYRGVEADDLAALAVQVLENEYDHIWLISTDGDWDCMMSENVSRFSFTVRREYRMANFYEQHECDNPEQFANLKAIMGDLGDNIRGVEGIGKKRGYNVLRTHGSVLDILDSLPLPGKQVYIQNLNKSAELLERNLMLVDLKSFAVEAVRAASVEFYDEFVAHLGTMGADK